MAASSLAIELGESALTVINLSLATTRYPIYSYMILHGGYVFRRNYLSVCDTYIFDGAWLLS